jgi:crotonobetainyl-CoA:carnitine CoA-transferase CaiB-like acyl-CoA transferase
MPGPLHGIRVLEFGQIIAGPVAGLYLSDLGAEVVKVEPLRGEEWRRRGAVAPNSGKWFQALNRGKRSITVDLATAEGRDVIYRLVPEFDVVLINYRYGVANRLGIDYESLKALRPDLIYASITGFGDQGPAAAHGGSDVVLQAYSGFIATEGKVDEMGTPVLVQVTPMIDRTSGMAATMGILGALYHRALTGDGQLVQSSMLHSALELLSQHVMREPVHDVTLRDPMMAQIAERRAQGASYEELLGIRRSSVRRFAAHNLYFRGYQTKRGALVLGALTNLNRDAIRRVTGIWDDTDSPDFDANDPENERRIEQWREQIQAKLMERTAEEWVAIFTADGVPASEVHFPEEMADDPQVGANEIMVDLVHDLTGPQRVVGPMMRLSKTPTEAQRAAPLLGTDTSDVLREAGFSEEEIARLTEAGVIGGAE